ncbi:MAG: hypothetical protein WAO76_13680 [Georgfuchsia sp.]
MSYFTFFTLVVLAAVLATVAPLVSDFYTKVTGREVKPFNSLRRMEWQIGTFSVAAFLLVLLAIYLAK